MKAAGAMRCNILTHIYNTKLLETLFSRVREKFKTFTLATFATFFLAFARVTLQRCLGKEISGYEPPPPNPNSPYRAWYAFQKSGFIFRRKSQDTTSFNLLSFLPMKFILEKILPPLKRRSRCFVLSEDQKKERKDLFNKSKLEMPEIFRLKTNKLSLSVSQQQPHYDKAVLQTLSGSYNPLVGTALYLPDNPSILTQANTINLSCPASCIDANGVSTACPKRFAININSKNNHKGTRPLRKHLVHDHQVSFPNVIVGDSEYENVIKYCEQWHLLKYPVCMLYYILFVC